MVNRKKPLIVVADPQFLVVSSLTTLINEENRFNLYGIAQGRSDLINLLETCKPDLLITDFNLFEYGGLDDLISIVNNNDNPSVLVLVNQVSCNEVSILAKAGIKNIALKTDDRQEILSSIEAALRKKKHFSDPILDMIIEQNESRNPLSGSSGLTQSETEIVKLIADGFTTKEIAERKHISAHTVMTHRKNIFRKLNVNSISDLTRFAIRNGLTDIIEYNI